MKKLLFSVIAFALITTSCNKYKDDFEALNARIDALAAQVAGVATLQTQLTATTAQITALQAAVAALPTTASITALQTALTNISNSISSPTGVQATLNSLALAVANGNTTTQQLINALTAQIGVNQTATITAIGNINTAIGSAITSINGHVDAQIAAAQLALTNAISAAVGNINDATVDAIADAQTALTDLINNQFGATNLAISNLSTQLANAVTTLNDSIAAAISAINADNTSQTVILTALIGQLQVALAIANAQIQTLLSSNNVFIGDLIINDEATLTAAEALGAKVRVITGNVNINTTGLDAAQMIRLKAVTNGVTLGGTPPPDRIFIGTVSGSVTLSGDKAIDLGSLVNVSGVTGDVTITGGANHILSALLAIKGNYSITGGDVQDDALTSVGGNLTLNYPAAYIYPNLTTVNGNISTTDGVSVTSVSFPVLSTIGGAIDGNTPTWAWATSVNLGAGNLTSLTANVATTIVLGEPTYPGTFTLTGNLASSLTMSASSVAGALNISIGSAIPGVNPVTTVNINSLTSTAGTITITTDASTNSTVSLNAYNDNDNIVINGPTVQTLPAYTGASGGLISSGSILTLSVPVYRAVTNVGTQFDGLTVLRNLTIGAARAIISTGSFSGDAAAALQTLNATYAAYTLAYQDYVDLNGMANLTSVSVSATGELSGVWLQNNPLLTSVTTLGQMDFFVVVNNDAVGLTLNMGNTAITSANGQGSYTNVDGNENLTSFTTSTSYMKLLDVSDNPNLTSVNFSSYVAGQNITAGTVTVYVAENKLAATYTASIFATNTAPVITTASGLTTLKAYMTNLFGSMAHTVDMQLGFSTLISGVDNSIALLDADATAFILAGGTINNTFVQRNGDAGGAMGSHVNVLRELNFIQ
ncbi:MAG: hypothetical protein ABUT20_17545 [Bacteroidota bacterium]